MAAEGSGQSREEDRAAAAVAAAAEFCCKYCDRKFNSKHALGGHQNAHRMERAMDWTAKSTRRGGAFMDFYGNPFSPFARFPPLLGAGAGQVNYWYHGAASMPPPYFRPGHPIPSPEIPARLPPYAYPFPPPVPQTTPLPSGPSPVENHSPHSQVLVPAPAMTVSGENTFPGGSVAANSSVTPSRPAGSIDINSNPMDTPEIIEDGELDLILKI